jgi:hypothetical protein
MKSAEIKRNDISRDFKHRIDGGVANELVGAFYVARQPG